MSETLTEENCEFLVEKKIKTTSQKYPSWKVVEIRLPYGVTIKILRK